MKLRKRLIIIFFLTSCAMLVICIPALLSYSRDIRNELSLSYGIPQEPQPILSNQPAKIIHADAFSGTLSSLYWLKSQQFYSYRQVEFILNQIRHLGFSAFLIQDSNQKANYYLGVGPFNTRDEAIDTSHILYQNHIKLGVIMNQMPNLDTLVF